MICGPLIIKLYGYASFLPRIPLSEDVRKRANKRIKECLISHQQKCSNLNVFDAAIISQILCYFQLRLSNLSCTDSMLWFPSSWYVTFYREFDFEKTMRLWEVLWTHYLSEHLHLYVCVAILRRHRSKIIGEEMDFDTLLKFINELSGHINLDATLRDAEALCICAGENGEACIPPGTPPSLPFETTSMYNQQDEDDIL